jgi:predicted outer membrane repeat protein
VPGLRVGDLIIFSFHAHGVHKSPMIAKGRERFQLRAKWSVLPKLTRPWTVSSSKPGAPMSSQPRCTIATGGDHDEGNGGGVYNFEGTVTLSGCTLSGNSAGFDGGAVYTSSVHPQAVHEKASAP